MLLEFVGTDVATGAQGGVDARKQRGWRWPLRQAQGQGNSVLIDDIGLNLGSSLVDGFPCGLAVVLALTAGMAETHGLIDQEARHVEVGMGRVVQQVFAARRQDPADLPCSG